MKSKLVNSIVGGMNFSVWCINASIQNISAKHKQCNNRRTKSNKRS